MDELNELRDAEEYLKHLDSLDGLERIRYMAFIINTEKSMAVEQARLQEAERCCQDTCLYCKQNYPVFLAENAMNANAPKQWAHKVPGSTFAKYCHAYAIRQRLAGGGK